MTADRGMYSRKEMHKWQGVPFLSGPYVEKHKEKLDARFLGKQFSTHPPKQGNAGMKKVLFSTVATYGTSYNEPYAVGNNYLKTYPPEKRKLGFGSHDAPKTGEFMSQQRSSQYKDTIAKSDAMEREGVMKKGNIDNQIEALKQKVEDIDEKFNFGTARNHPDDFAGNVPKTLYDIGHTEHGSTPVFLKDTRDKFYSHKRCIDAKKPRHVQNMALISGDYGHPELKPFDKLRVKSYC